MYTHFIKRTHTHFSRLSSNAGIFWVGIGGGGWRVMVGGHNVYDNGMEKLTISHAQANINHRIEINWRQWVNWKLTHKYEPLMKQFRIVWRWLLSIVASIYVKIENEYATTVSQTHRTQSLFSLAPYLPMSFFLFFLRFFVRISVDILHSCMDIGWLTHFVWIFGKVKVSKYS